MHFMRKKPAKTKFYGSQKLKAHKAWRVFSEWTRKSSANCYCCGKRIDWKKAHASHYIAGSVCGKTLFFDERNVKPSCAACNLFLHGNIPQFALHLKRDYGDSILEELDTVRLSEKNAGIICRYSSEELEVIYQKYTKKLKKLSTATPVD